MSSMLDRVRQVIADSLFVGVDEVSPDASLMKDLGMESLDLLDIGFRFESEFGIKFPIGEVERQIRRNFTDDQFSLNGVLTAAALAELPKVLPEADHSKIKPGMTVRDIPGLFTARIMTSMVERQIQATQDEDKDKDAA